MPNIPSLTTFTPGQNIQSSQVNANFTAITNAYNTSAVLTDVARTITAAQTFNGGANVTGFKENGPRYDVTHPAFGAKGDGVTDDAVAIQAAVTAAHGVGGAIVFFPPGIYRCASTITVTNATILQGSGTAWTVAGGTPDPVGTTTLKFDTGVTGIILTSASQSYKPVVRDMEVRGGNYLIAGTNDGIQIRAHALLSNVVVWQFGRDGVSIDSSGGANCSNSSLYDVWSVQNGRRGFYTTGPDSNVILFSKCDAMSNGDVGFYDTALYMNTYLSPHCDGNTVGAFTLGGTGHSVINPYIESSGSNTVRFITGSSGFNWMRATQFVAGGSFVIEANTSAHNITHGNQIDVRIGFSGTFTYDASSCPVVGLRCSNNATLAVPTNAYHGATVQFLIWNTKGTLLTTTWTGGAGGYLLAGAWTDPLNGTGRAITFRFDAIAQRWSEVCRTTADYV